jgi:hypothetical protein
LDSLAQRCFASAKPLGRKRNNNFRVLAYREKALFFNKEVANGPE